MYKYIGQRIREAREAKKLSQKKLGLILGLSDKAISAYEAGRTYPPLETLFKISKELSRPVIYFLSQDGNEVVVHNSISKIESQLEAITDELKLLKGLAK